MHTNDSFARISSCCLNFGTNDISALSERMKSWPYRLVLAYFHLPCYFLNYVHRRNPIGCYNDGNIPAKFNHSFSAISKCNRGTPYRLYRQICTFYWNSVDLVLKYAVYAAK